MNLTKNRKENVHSIVGGIIPTKGKSLKTQAEFVSEIRELARQAAMTTNKAESEYISKQVLCLRVEGKDSNFAEKQFV